MNEENQQDIITRIENIDSNLNKLNEEFVDSVTYFKENTDFENINKQSQTDLILSLIFGFLVGYCLIKSFFDGLKV